MVATGEAKERDEEDGDLLLENPNHAGAAWRPYHEDESDGSDGGEDRVRVGTAPLGCPS